MNPFEDNRTEARRELERQSGFGPNFCSTPDRLHEYIARALVSQLEKQEQELGMLRYAACRYLEEVDEQERKRNETKKAETPAQ